MAGSRVLQEWDDSNRRLLVLEALRRYRTMKRPSDAVDRIASDLRMERAEVKRHLVLALGSIWPSTSPRTWSIDPTDPDLPEVVRERIPNHHRYDA